jgi:ribonuclease D
MAELTAIKGTPRALMERAGGEVLAAVRRGLEAPEKNLPEFPRGKRWNKDGDFDARVARLKTVRDEAAVRLNLDPGVLCSRERLEAVARIKPASIAEVVAIPELRRWQAEELGAEFVRVLRSA